MTFYIDQWQDLMMDGWVVQLRDESGYVRHVISNEDLERTNLPRSNVIRITLERLCDKWEEARGQKLYVIEPVGEGQEWTVSTEPPVIEGEVIDGEIAPPQTMYGIRPHRPMTAEEVEQSKWIAEHTEMNPEVLRELMDSDKRKAITDR